MHLSKTSLPSASAAAHYYHDHCVTALISLQENDETIPMGIPLAAVELLRSYETLWRMQRPVSLE
jgi:hypothetical protein